MTTNPEPGETFVNTLGEDVTVLSVSLDSGVIAYVFSADLALPVRDAPVYIREILHTESWERRA